MSLDYFIMAEKLLCMTGLSLERIGAFLEIAEARGISRAAKGNPNRQSQLSRQLAELESFFGTALINRGRSVPFSLTEAGRRLKAIAIQNFASLNELKQTTKEAPLIIRIGAGESLLTWLAIPAVGSISGLSSEIGFSFLNRQTSDILRGVTECSIDVGIVRQAPSTSGVHKVYLGTISMVLVKPVALVTSKRALLPTARLDGSAGPEEWGKSRDLHMHPHLRFRCTSYSQIQMLVRSHKCAALLPHFMVEEFKSPDFIIEKANPKDTRIQLHAVFGANVFRLRPKAEKAIKLFTEAAKRFLS